MKLSNVADRVDVEKPPVAPNLTDAVVMSVVASQAPIIAHVRPSAE